MEWASRPMTFPASLTNSTESNARSVSGTGLGLSISKGIVEAHHGTIYARDRDGGGAIVSVELPLDEKQEEGQ